MYLLLLPLGQNIVACKISSGSVHMADIVVVGVWMGTERCAEEFGRFGTEECVQIGIFIHVS